MKKIIVMALVFAVFAIARDVLDISSYCNNGYSASNQYNVPQIADSSCYLNTVAVTPGLDMNILGLSYFFFDTNVDFPGSDLKLGNQSVPIRFVVFDDEANYNAVQALIQTAYATRAPVTIIFANPKLKKYEFSEFMLSKRKTEKKCYVAKDLNNDVVSINCPIQSILLGLN